LDIPDLSVEYTLGVPTGLRVSVRPGVDGEPHEVNLAFIVSEDSPEELRRLLERLHELVSEMARGNILEWTQEPLLVTREPNDTGDR
jgi:hypothetical protein